VSANYDKAIGVPFVGGPMDGKRMRVNGPVVYVRIPEPVPSHWEPMAPDKIAKPSAMRVGVYRVYDSLRGQMMTYEGER
jgi:hypothetical protein